jgi:hypothetical protein
MFALWKSREDLKDKRDLKSSIILITSIFWNAEREMESADQENGPQIACDERMLQDLLNSRTPLQYLSAIQDAKPTKEAADTAPFVASNAGTSALPQLAGESGGVLTQTEFRIT